MVVRDRQRRLAGSVRGAPLAGERTGPGAAGEHHRGHHDRSENRRRDADRTPAAKSRYEPTDDADGRLRRGEERRGGETRCRAAATPFRAALDHRRDAVYPDRQHERVADHRRQRLAARRRHRDQRRVDGAGQQRRHHDVQLEHQRLPAGETQHLLFGQQQLPVRSAGHP